MRRTAVIVATGVALAAAVPVVDRATAAWAFVSEIAPPVSHANAGTRRVPGSNVRYTDADLDDLGRAVDWFPAAHPTMPPAVGGVADGRVAACGYCHLPGGEGRVENVALAGLDADYLRAQVTAFANDTRTAAVPGWIPSMMMRSIAHGASPATVAAAARYFSRLRFVSHVRVVETATVPALRPHGFMLARVPGPAEPLGDRIAETPDDLAAFDARDPRVGYTAFVPPGSLKAGAAITARVGCATCHGAGLRLWGAGRSPTYIFRQLLAFKTGARHDAEAAPMTSIAARLSPADMIAVAAYWGSLRP